MFEPFVRSVDISSYSKFQICNLESVDQGHDEQHSQLRHSISDFLSFDNVNACSTTHRLQYYRITLKKYQNIDLENEGQGKGG